MKSYEGYGQLASSPFLKHNAEHSTTVCTVRRIDRHDRPDLFAENLWFGQLLIGLSGTFCVSVIAGRGSCALTVFLSAETVFLFFSTGRRQRREKLSFAGAVQVLTSHPP
ncbi:hypothetical protein SKAU_G00179210 [Synaphobranchus kaupii]|uniref:Uncharacterized protein n=1 Tax=Synaphobranchus kaupii TaxID=118154 RepID=A0A9Q1J0K3_SYNKA|nr:hypothetical protein SKAU_G00179210 [Synaphobranchus kaupii]